jgi:endonuclease/exonuclease/phosphatase family metal-dependent hydrolase
MRLLTLNIRMGAGGGVLKKPAYDVPASARRDADLARAMAAAGADIVALQEVRGRRQTEKLAARLDMGWLYMPHPRSYALDFFEWGLALLYRFRLRRQGNFAVYFDTDVRSGRNGLWAEFEDRQTVFSVVNVHLDMRDMAGQVKALKDRIDALTGPAIVMGDFNATREESALKPLRQTLADTCRAVDTPGSREADAVGTLVGARRRIDQIWVSAGGFRVRDAGLLPPSHRDVSDHLGYYADIIPAA